LGAKKGFEAGTEASVSRNFEVFRTAGNPVFADQWSAAQDAARLRDIMLIAKRQRTCTI
jgi:hypothetical protein